MNTFTPLYESSDISTPEGLSPAIPIGQISGVPLAGTGLMGTAYAPGDSIRSLDDLADVIANNEPDATFVASELVYGAKDSDTSLAEFLAEDAGSIEGNGAVEMGPSGLVMKGFVYIPAGPHEVAVSSDDGFDLKLGGVDFTEFAGVRSADDTGRVAEFEGGLYEIEITYFDAGGRMELVLELDGLPIDQSAFYQSIDDFQNPPAGTPTVPPEDYHSSYTLGDEVIDDTTPIETSDARDVIEAKGGDDSVDGQGGDDEIYGGYGDDQIYGGDGDDVIDGGRGSDMIVGGAGNDILISRSDAGEQRIGQLAIGNPTRPDPDGEVNQDRQKLIGWENMPLVSDDILVGGEGEDIFLFSPQINAKLEIIEKHTRADGSINWAGVAGENDELHDHWVDAWGIDVIADYVAGEDQIAIIGHTAEICDISYRDVDGDGDLESIITVHSNQSGPCARTGQPTCNCQADLSNGGGGAHDRDILGYIVVHGDRVEEDDVQLDAGVTYGIVDNIADVAEALNPFGETKVTEINGEMVYGYDTRDDQGGLGAITERPEDFIENPYLAQVQTVDPVDAPEIEYTREPFEPLGTVEVEGVTVIGTGRADVLMSDGDAAALAAAESDLPAALAVWDFASMSEGATEDAKGGPTAKAYTLYENQALLRTDGLVEGPDGTLSALSFNGEDEFAYIPHDPKFQFSQGTIAMWVKPEDLDDESMFVTKDQRNSGDGGHFRLGHTKDGGLFLRMAPGDGGSNKSWETGPILTEGQWQHVAVSFTATGVVVYLDGQAVPANAWTPDEGDVPSPNVYTEAYLIANAEPWVLGADQARTDRNETAGAFAIDDEDLDNAYEGAIADFTIWGGYEPTDALTAAEIQQIATPRFDAAAIPGPSGNQPMEAGNDTFNAGSGNDVVYGGAGDDTVNAGTGDDSVEGGYGDDLIYGGEGNDTMDGGWGSDALFGGAGDDTLIARSDAGEDRAGQLVLGEPSRPSGNQIDEQYLKLVDWIDQPLVADDILHGGEGNDHFQIETLINGTRDSILDNTKDDGRGIRWHGVAGENNQVHDHWVDSIGIDVIADFKADEDHISIIGHTTQVEVDYKSHDSDGDGQADSVVSVITVYSQQGNGGGAHDEDYLGYVVVHGDIVTEDMIETDAGAHYGVVDTIDELQEAFAPTGETKVRDYNGVELFGYDSRDVEGDPIGSDPEAFAENPYADLVTYEDQTIDDLAPLNVLLTNEGASFDGSGYGEIAHDPALQQEDGTIAFSFTANTPGDGNQAILSKDHSGNKDGGHFTAWIGNSGHLEVRFQDDGNISRYLKFSDEKIQAGATYHVAFSFDENTLALYVNGDLVDAEDGFPGGMTGNTEETLVGASARTRQGDNDNAEWLFNGDIGPVSFLDRPLTLLESILISEAGGDIAVLLDDSDGETGGEDPIDEEDDQTPALTVIDGTEAGELIRGTEEAEQINGHGGNDRIVSREGNDVVYGGEGDDQIYTQVGDDEAAGGAGKDFIGTGDGNDIAYGGDDDDRINTGTGDDEAWGEAGDDQIATGVGSDTAYGGEGNDRIYMHDGDDQATGGAGNDRIGTGNGNDIAYGGGGEDLLFTGDGNDIAHGGEGDDRIGTGTGDDEVSGEAGNDRIVTGAGSDTAYGGEGDDRIKTDADDDEVYGGAGDDRIRGGDGEDLIVGGEGNDIVAGGNGADTFSFAEFGLGNFDHIRDFEVGIDKIALDQGVFDGINGDALGDQFITASEAQSAEDRVIYDANSGHVLYDADGTGEAEAQFIARIGRDLGLTESDFTLV
ncbi:MAG: LamG-like jellyroll fold domain-containing protein [Pseudomonadota bacterium]